MPNRREEILYANLCIAKGSGVRDTLSALAECLKTRASNFGVNLNSLTKFLQRKALRTNAADLMVLIDARRVYVLQRVAAIGSGRWRSDLTKYYEQTGPPALDDIFLLGDEESDNVWGDLMPLVLRRPIPESKYNDYAGCRRDAINEALSTVLMSSRAALTVAIVRPNRPVKVPVCVGYCGMITENVLRREATRAGKNILYDDGVFFASAADGGAPADFAGAGISSEDGSGTELSVAASQPEESGVMAGEVTRFVDAIARFNAAAPEAQREIVHAVWRELPPDKQETLLLSHSLQDPKKTSGLPDYLKSPLLDVHMGGGINGARASERLGIKPNAFYKRVHDANAEFETCVIQQVNIKNPEIER